MNHIDAEFTDHPTTGVETMSKTLRRYHELTVNPKRVRRLMRLMGLMAIYPKPRTTERIIEHSNGSQKLDSGLGVSSALY